MSRPPNRRGCMVVILATVAFEVVAVCWWLGLIP